MGMSVAMLRIGEEQLGDTELEEMGIVEVGVVNTFELGHNTLEVKEEKTGEMEEESNEE